MGIIQKTTRYLKRNGLKKTYYAVLERLFCKDVPFRASKPCVETQIDEKIKFSVLVPVYETPEKYLREMIESVLGQIYGNFELVLTDASKTTGPKSVIETYTDSRIKYVRVEKNGGISENTNVAIDNATGDYCCLLDHDDFLVPEALYENALLITQKRLAGIDADMIYSDEDKCDGKAEKFFEPHYKEDFNLDLLLSNNYICHFTVIRTSVIKTLRFRKEYDGAQDYDLFLRVVKMSGADRIFHIGKILYHWRCHEASTALNTDSKEYAYVAGRRAVEDFVNSYYNAKPLVVELAHKGFYRVVWGDSIFSYRTDVGAIGTVRVKTNRIVNGIFMDDGRELFVNMNKNFSGYMHRAVTTRDVFCCDLRTVTPSPELKADYDELVSKLEKAYKEGLKGSALEDYVLALSVEFAKRVRSSGKLFLYDGLLQ